MNKNLIGAILGYAILVALSIGAFLAAIVARGIALLWLWAWFVAPFGIMSLGFWHALGISGLVAFLTYELNTPADGDVKKEAFVGVFKSIFMSLGALFFGFIYQLFM